MPWHQHFIYSSRVNPIFSFLTRLDWVLAEYHRQYFSSGTSANQLLLWVVQGKKMSDVHLESNICFLFSGLLLKAFEGNSCCRSIHFCIILHNEVFVRGFHFLGVPCTFTSFQIYIYIPVVDPGFPGGGVHSKDGGAKLSFGQFFPLKTAGNSEGKQNEKNS